MTSNVFGEEYQSADDIIDSIIPEIQSMKGITFKPSEDKAYGVTIDTNEKISKRGLYCIYRNEKLMYVGQTNLSIRKRLSYFCVVLKEMNTHFEDHPGARKQTYTIKYALNMDEAENLTVKFIDINRLNVSKAVRLIDLEKSLIYKLRPVFNSEILKSCAISIESIV